MTRPQAPVLGRSDEGDRVWIVAAVCHRRTSGGT